MNGCARSDATLDLFLASDQPPSPSCIHAAPSTFFTGLYIYMHHQSWAPYQTWALGGRPIHHTPGPALTLWTVRNRLVIQCAPLRRATDAIFKMGGYLQLWRLLSHPQDRDAIDIFIADLRPLPFRLAHPLPPPPPDLDWVLGAALDLLGRPLGHCFLFLSFRAC